jgi:ribosomal protein S18 acetylase RimI-like enzyme
MTTADVGKVVEVHLRSFPGFFLTFLGAAFLRQLYAGIVEDPSGIAIVAESGSSPVVGFVAGTVQPSGFYRRLIANRLFGFARASFVPLVRKPAILPRLVRALAMPGKVAAAGEGALLMSLAVAPDVQGAGIGPRLSGAFVSEAAARGARRVFLTTDKIGNDAVNLFYQRQGFRITRTLTTPEGREMNEYEIDLNEGH